jgi:hypothetical protein
MTLLDIRRLLLLEPSKQLGPVNRLIVVRHDLQSHAVASYGMNENDNVICWGITGDGDGLAFSSIEPEWHPCFAFRVASYRFWFSRR